MTAEVKPVGKDFGVYIGEHLIGTTKLQCDAQMHANKINETKIVTPQQALAAGITLRGYVQHIV